MGQLCQPPSVVSTNPTTPAQWATLVLAYGCAPLTETNVNNMLVWMQNENYPQTWATRNNPLNASLNTSATDGTGSYPSLNAAAQSTAQMIFGQSNMAPIAAALSTGSSSQAAFGSAVISSPWASSHYGYDVGRFTGSTDALLSQTGAGGSPGGQAQGPQYLGLENPTRCVWSLPVVGCVVNAGQARKLKGYSVMSVGGVVMVIGIGVVFAAIGLGRNPAVRLAQRVGATSLGGGRTSSTTVDAVPAGAVTEEVTDPGDEIAEAEGIPAPGRGGNRGGPGARSTMNRDIGGSRERYMDEAA